MAEYSDLQQIEALYAEQAMIEQALTILEEHDGTVSSFTVAAPLEPIAVMIITVDPKQNLMAAAHASLVQRYNTINQELRDLGVTGGPPDHAQGGGPPVEPLGTH